MSDNNYYPRLVDDLLIRRVLTAAWCPACGRSWTHETRAVRFMPYGPAICEHCVRRAAEIVNQEDKQP